jgi:transcriptional regulator with XRE-family HTH domain
MMRGVAVKDFREKHGLTQLRLAYLLDVTPTTVSRWENEQQARPRMLELALKGLAVELSEASEGGQSS